MPIRSNRTIFTLALPVLILLWWNLLLNSAHRWIGVDEFYYGCSAWQIAHGFLPMRDFSCGMAGLPLFLSLICRWFPDGPAVFLSMRFAMHIFLALVIASEWKLNQDEPFGARLYSVLLTLSYPPFLHYLLEVRLDAAAAALVFASLALLSGENSRRRAREFLSGALLVSAGFVSIKVSVYGLAIPLAAVVWRVWQGEKPGLIRFPTRYLLGAGLCGAAIALYCQVTYGFVAWWKDFLELARIHENLYPRHAPSNCFHDFFKGNHWLIALSAIGFVDKLWTRLEQRWSPTDTALFVLVPMSVLSVTIQRGPNPYSVLPLAIVLLIFAGRAMAPVVHLIHSARSGSQWIGLALCAALLYPVFAGAATTSEFRRRDNSEQLNQMRMVARLTSENDAAFDGFGGFIVRPSASYYIFLDVSVVKAGLADHLPADLQRNQCVLWMDQSRDDAFPSNIRRFADANYVNYGHGIRLWGRRYSVDDSKTATFFAIKDGTYYVSPRALADGRRLKIDGKTIATDEFRLTRGAHAVNMSGFNGTFLIGWLPANGLKNTVSDNVAVSLHG